MPFIKAMKIAGMSEFSKAATFVSIAIVVYLGFEIYKNYKESKVLEQQKKINEYILAEYVARYPKP